MLGDYDNQNLINKGLEGISKVEAISNMIIPHNGKIILTQKPHIITKKKECTTQIVRFTYMAYHMQLDVLPSHGVKPT